MLIDRRRLLDRAVLLVWVAGLGAVLLWPITRSGYLLGHDMVFTSEQPLDAQTIGVSSAPPRAVPLDMLVALAERVGDGSVIGRLAVVLPLLGAGVGVGLLLGAVPLAGRIAAASVAVWNPYVVERMALGQWALLWCYAALPWLVMAIVRGRGATGWFARATALASASITPTGGLIAAVCAVAVTAGLRRRRAEVLRTAGLAVALQLPWLLAAAVSTASVTSDPAGVTAFASRAEHPGGVLLTLLGGGGIWDAEVVPGSRAGALAWLWLAVLAAAAWYGLPRLVDALGARLVATLGVLAGWGLVLAVLPSVPGGAALVRAAVNDVPGAGLLRDAQKWVLPLVVLEALLVGAAAARLAERLATLPWRLVLWVAAAVTPVILFPDAARTLRPTLEPVHYPLDWSRVAEHMSGGGDAAVLPWGSYRRFGWAPGRSVLDPAPRLLPGPTVVDDRLVVGTRQLAGEDPRARLVQQALFAGRRMPAALAANGIRWVVVEQGTPGRLPGLTGLEPAHVGRDVALYKVPGEVAVLRPASARVIVVVAGCGAAGLVLLCLAGWAGWNTVRRRTQPGDLSGRLAVDSNRERR